MNAAGSAEAGGYSAHRPSRMAVDRFTLAREAQHAKSLRVSSIKPTRFLFVLALNLFACADDAASSPADDANHDDASDSANESPFEHVSEGQLCSLELSSSDQDDVEAVLGPPSSEEPSGSGVVLRYEDGKGAAWIFFFDESGVWTGITVESAGSTTTVPSCWAPDGGWFERPDGGWYQR